MNDRNLRAKLTEFMKITIVKSAPQFHILSTIEYSDYHEHLISYEGTESSVIKAFLLMPKMNRNGKGILIHHQHNGERHFGKSEVIGKVGDENQHFGVKLVKMGFVVLAPDSICFEDRRNNCTGTIEHPDDFIQHYVEMNKRILVGESLMKKVIEESSIAISILSELDYVNENEIGILGHSYGGTTAIFHSALDERIKYICTSGAVASFKCRVENGTGIEMASIIPGFMNKFEMIDLVKSILPRKLLIVSADEDKYSKDANIIYEKIIAEMGEDTKSAIQLKQLTGGHPLTEERVSAIMEWLKLI